jgi:hypothetical protein
LLAGAASLRRVVIAEMTLRFGSIRVPTAVRWPSGGAGSLALVLGDESPGTDPWLESCVVVSVGGEHPLAIELAALHWASDHRGELGAVGDRMLLAGGARAARLALAARFSGWRLLKRQVLVHPRFTAEQPMPTEVGGAAPALVVCGDGQDDGSRYAARLRAAGVEVHEVRPDGYR